MREKSERRKKKKKLDPHTIADMLSVETGEVSIQQAKSRGRSGDDRNNDGGAAVDKPKKRPGKGLNIFKNKRDKSKTANNQHNEQ